LTELLILEEIKNVSVFNDLDLDDDDDDGDDDDESF